MTGVRKRIGDIGGEDPAARLRRAVASAAGDEDPPDDAQIAMVLHALADQTALMQALRFDVDAEALGSLSAEASSVGRWLHAYGDLMRERLDVDRI